MAIDPMFLTILNATPAMADIFSGRVEKPFVWTAPTKRYRTYIDWARQTHAVAKLGEYLGGELLVVVAEADENTTVFLQAMPDMVELLCCQLGDRRILAALNADGTRIAWVEIGA